MSGARPWNQRAKVSGFLLEALSFFFFNSLVLLKPELEQAAGGKTMLELLFFLPGLPKPLRHGHLGSKQIIATRALEASISVCVVQKIIWTTTG